MDSTLNLAVGILFAGFGVCNQHYIRRLCFTRNKTAQVAEIGRRILRKCLYKIVSASDRNYRHRAVLVAGKIHTRNNLVKGTVASAGVNPNMVGFVFKTLFHRTDSVLGTFGNIYGFIFYIKGIYCFGY